MERNLKRLVKDLENPDDDLRALSAMTLLKLDVPDPISRTEIIACLVKATKDKNVSVRFFSRKAIDKLKKAREEQGSFAETLPLAQALIAEDYEVRLEAVMRVGRENKAEFKEQLLTMLQTERHDFVKASLISCLKKFLPKEEARHLSRFLHDPDNRVRSNTIETLEYLKADESIPNLFPCLEDPDNRIRAVAAKALQSFGEEKVFAVLRKMLHSKEEWMKVSAIYAISHIQASEAIQLLLDTAKTPGPSETRQKAIIALANYHDTSTYSFLRFMAASGEEPLKSVAFRAFKLAEEKFGLTPPTSTLIEPPKIEKPSAADGKVKPASGKSTAASDLGASVTQFFRKGKDAQVGLSPSAAISFSVTDLQHEQDELMKEGGRVLFETYQRGDVKIPELLTVCHEILQMNFFIQKYTEEEEKKQVESKKGFFAHLKSLFTSHTDKQHASPVDKFTQKREALFLKLGKTAFFKMKIREFSPLELEGYYQAFLQIEEKIQREKEKAGI